MPQSEMPLSRKFYILWCRTCTGVRFISDQHADICSQAAAITNVIDTISGDVEIKCSTQSDGSVQCAFLQATISSVFGSSGLVMNDCQIGECVAQSVIDTANGATPTGSTTGSKTALLSGGVIAGIAVLGGIVLGFLLLFLWGWVVQIKARKAGNGQHIKSGGVCVTWSAINYSVPSSSSRSLFKRNGTLLPAGDKLILNDLSGEVNPGEMLAILGPSGAGKTTFIEILGGKSKMGTTTGNVTFTAVSPTGERTAISKQPRIGYVDQADILPSMLTVHEALLFAARLRLPDSVSEQSKQERVFEVMKQLGILDIKDTRIGNHERRGISGGEQRRVSIGLELVACPDILVLDEPTSGVYSYFVGD
jgi:ABC-type lipoprotein export system ATPase subunit